LSTRQYPKGLVDLFIGIKRWLYRVLTYVGLMTTSTRHSVSIKASTSPVA